MNQYYFDLLGLRMVLQSPEPVTLSKRLTPFLCSPYTEKADCTIEIVVCQSLPEICSENWSGLECFDYQEGSLRIFHCHKLYGEPFAVTCLKQEGDVQIRVLADYADYFSGSSGIFNRIGFENLLLRHQGLLLHASLIEYAQKGIAFTGPSGVGKSTQADLWQRFLGAKILNGDRAALRRLPQGWMAYGSPYAGTSGIYRKGSAPLSAVVVLKQGTENSLRRLSAGEALVNLWPELSARRTDPVFVTELSGLCAKLIAEVPVYLLECVPSESAVDLLKKGLSL